MKRLLQGIALREFFGWEFLVFSHSEYKVGHRLAKFDQPDVLAINWF